MRFSLYLPSLVNNAFHLETNISCYQISAKNKYGWGPPSSTFTFYNKGVGKKSREKGDRQQNVTFTIFPPRLFNPADQVQGAKSGQRSEEGIFQYTRQEKIILHFCADISYMNFLHIPPTLVDPNTKNC